MLSVSLILFAACVEMTMTSVSLALREINAPRAEPIRQDTLLECLRASAVVQRWRPHVRAFLEELRIGLIHDIALDSYLTFQELARAADTWGVRSCKTVDWIREMARLKTGKD